MRWAWCDELRCCEHERLTFDAPRGATCSCCGSVMLSLELDEGETMGTTTQEPLGPGTLHCGGCGRFARTLQRVGARFLCSACRKS